MESDRVIRADVISAKEIIVGDATIKSTAEGTGVWLTDKSTGACLCICVGFGQGAQVSVRSGNQQGAHDLSLYADKDGAYIQLFNVDGNHKRLSVGELIHLLSRSD